MRLNPVYVPAVSTYIYWKRRRFSFRVVIGMCVLTLLNNERVQNVTFGSQHIQRKLSKANKTNHKPLSIENTYVLTEAMRKVISAFADIQFLDSIVRDGLYVIQTIVGTAGCDARVIVH